jgi:hypothetical protein
MISEYIGLLGVVVILLGGFYIFYTSRQRNQRIRSVSVAQQDVSYPLRLQAYERMILFLERIKPQSLLTRIQLEGMSRLDLQSTILRDVRAEFDHNAAQQLYISKETWEKISVAATTVSGSLVHTISQSPEGLDTKGVVVHLLQHEDVTATQLIQNAINAIKDEAEINIITN